MHKREFNSTDHLNPEAVAAYVDGELTAGAYRRATKHLDDCEECLAEVAAQRRAADRLRVADDSQVHAPASLVERLASLHAEDARDARDEPDDPGATGAKDGRGGIAAVLGRIARHGTSGRE